MIYRIIIIIFLLFTADNLFSKPYGLRESNKFFQFNGTVELNYSIINHEPFIQLVAIPEFTFGEINFGFGFYFPVALNFAKKLRTISYNSLQSIAGKIYYIQYGIPGKDIFVFKISPIEDYTLGYGLILLRYSNNLFFPEIRKLGLRFSFSYKGFELQGILGDISTYSVLGGRFSINIGKLFDMESGILASIDIGITAVSDISPKTRDIIKVESNHDHKIVRASGQIDPVTVFGTDLGITFVDHPYMKFGLYSEFAAIVKGKSISGYAIGYGIIGVIAPSSAKINYKFQFRHFFDSFMPSYFNSIYDGDRYFKVDSIMNESADMGFYIELSRFFFRNKMAVIVAYEHVFNGSYSPHLFFGFYLHELVERLNITFKYDIYNISDIKDFANIKRIDTIFSIEAFYSITNNVEVGISYKKGLTIEGASNSPISNLSSLTIYTKVVF